MISKTVKLEVLRQKLHNIPDGPVGTEIESALFDCWPEFIGSSDHNTTKYKLCRTENLRWERPCLRFTLERHPGMKSGRTRAVVHQWSANVETGVANWAFAGYRQKEPSAPALKVKPPVDQVVHAVVGKADVPEIKWLTPDRLRVLVGKLIPDEGPKQTVAGRRKRFARALEEALRAVGWIEVRGTSSHTYQRQENASSSAIR